MYTVSTAFLTELASPSMLAAVRVTTTDGTVLAITGGSVTMESRRAIARDCSLTLVPTTGLSVTDIYDLVMTPSTEIVVKRGLMVAGVPEYVTLGVFSTDTAQVSLNAAGAVAWTGSDRSKKIRRARFIDPYTIASGTTLAAAGAALLADRWPLVTTDFANVTATIGTNIVYEQGPDSDPWESARDLFSSRGYDLHFNGAGVAVATIITDSPIVAFSFGSGETSLVIGGDLDGSLDGVYNGVVATGEGSELTEPVRAEVWDTNESSPTYHLGSYGKVPYFYTSPLLTTTAQCTIAATTILARVKGGAQVLSWPAVVNPALEPYDCVSVTFGATTTAYVIDRLTIPLMASEAMQGVARKTVIRW